MTTQIHECHPHDTKEQLYDVRLHDVQLQNNSTRNHHLFVSDKFILLYFFQIVTIA